jgi:hypothetical protein
MVVTDLHQNDPETCDENENNYFVKSPIFPLIQAG